MSPPPPAPARHRPGGAAVLGLLAACLVAFTLGGARPAAAAGGDTDVRPALAFMWGQVGKPYVWAATGPNSWDCSAVVQAAYQKVGISLPRVTQDQVNFGAAVDPGDVRPGDLFFSLGAPSEHGTPQARGHVGMYVGGHKVIEAKGKAYGVVVSTLAEWRKKAVAIRRPGRSTPTPVLISQAAAKEGLPVKLLATQINQESGGDPTISSPYADGVAQFTPASWKGWGQGGDVWDPKDAIPAMARFDAALIRANHGSVDLALAGYNAGQGAVDKYRGVPPFPETRNYIASIEGASGIRGVITLHPAPVVRSLPAEIGHEIGHSITHPLPAPALPRNPTQAVHDIGTGLMVVLIALGLYRKLHPHLRMTLAASTASRARRRPAARAARAWTARDATSRTAGRPARRRTRVTSSARRHERNRRNADVVETVIRRAASKPASTAGKPASGRRKPASTAGKPASGRRKPASTAGKPASGRRKPVKRPRQSRGGGGGGWGWLVWFQAAPRGLLLLIVSWWSGVSRTGDGGATGRPADRSAHGPRAGRPAAPDPATAGRGGTARPLPAPAYEPYPADGLPWRGSAPRALVPDAFIPRQLSSPPHPSGAAVATIPYDIDWPEHLADPGFAQFIRAHAFVEALDLSDAQVVASLLVWMDAFLTSFAEGLDQTVDDLNGRRLDSSIPRDVEDGVSAIQDACDWFRSAAANLFDKHPDFFTVRLSKPEEPVASRHGR